MEDPWRTPITGLYPADEERRQLGAALANDARRRMLHFISLNGRCRQVDLVRECSIPQALASRGLASLVKAGLLRPVVDDKLTYYVADPERLRRLFRWLEELARVFRPKASLP